MDTTVGKQENTTLVYYTSAILILFLWFRWTDHLDCSGQLNEMHIVDFCYIEFCAFFPLNTKALAELQVQILYLLLIPPSRSYNYMDLNGTWLN